MNNHFNIHDNTVHLWRLFLPDFSQYLPNLAELLSHDEAERAQRFHQAIHRERFIITRAILRTILGLYAGINPNSVSFGYGEHGKPYLAHNNAGLMFNISHSHEIAVFALTIHKEIGIDIEQMEALFKESVAKRFFNQAEYSELMELPQTERIAAFYKIWSRKEALIKLLGKGLYTALDSFTVSSKPERQSVTFDKNQEYLIQHVTIQPEYQAALAIKAPLTHVIQWQWTKEGPVKD